MQNHAVDTYSVFAEDNKSMLESIPPPLVALNYYKSGDLYLFDQLCTAWKSQELRRPSCSNLYEVFVNIRDDEIEHVKTMYALKTGNFEIDNSNYKLYDSSSEGQRILNLDQSMDYDEEYEDA